MAEELADGSRVEGQQGKAHGWCGFRSGCRLPAWVVSFVEIAAAGPPARTHHQTGREHTVQEHPHPRDGPRAVTPHPPPASRCTRLPGTSPTRRRRPGARGCPPPAVSAAGVPVHAVARAPAPQRRRRPGTRGCPPGCPGTSRHDTTRPTHATPRPRVRRGALCGRVGSLRSGALRAVRVRGVSWRYGAAVRVALRWRCGSCRRGGAVRARDGPGRRGRDVRDGAVTVAVRRSAA